LQGFHSAGLLSTSVCVKTTFWICILFSGLVGR